MKRIVLLLSVCLLTLQSFSQKEEKYSVEDVKQFYRTIQGDYTGNVNDSTTLTLHFTPIWEQYGDPFRWLYLEAINKETKEIVEQKIIEIKANSDISFDILVHNIANAEQFAGKWSNRNFFDGFNTKILKGHSTFVFMKTKDFEYQTGWSGRKALKCFPKGDRLHFKFMQEGERMCIKRVPGRSTNIIGITFFKAPTD